MDVSVRKFGDVGIVQQRKMKLWSLYGNTISLKCFARFLDSDDATLSIVTASCVPHLKTRPSDRAHFKMRKHL